MIPDERVRSTVDSANTAFTGREFVAAVTGATGGVGSAVAHRLAANGGSLVLLGRREDALAALADKIGEDTSAIRTICADLCRKSELERAVSQIRETVGRLDALVHAAGVFVRGKLDETLLEEFDEVFQVNTRARFFLTRELIPLMSVRGGQVVFVNSSLGLRSDGGVGAYAGTMHADRALADALREEVNEDDVRVMTIYLGRTATPMQEEIHEDEGRPYDPSRLIQPETVAEVVEHALKMGPDAEITDVTIRSMRKPAPPTTDAENR